MHTNNKRDLLKHSLNKTEKFNLCQCSGSLNDHVFFFRVSKNDKNKIPVDFQYIY